MAAVTQALFLLPTSWFERWTLEEELRIPATLEQYFEFAEQADFKVEYSNGHIISMGQATDAHELICINIGTAFNILFADDPEFRAYGSNLGIFIPDTEAHYKPDISILRTAPVFIRHKVKKLHLKSVLNPLAAIEVFSDSTQDYDVDEKLPNYKQSPSLRYIIYIHQHKPFVTIFTRSADGVWLEENQEGLDSAFIFEGKTVLLKDIYKRVIFMGSNGEAKSKT